MLGAVDVGCHHVCKLVSLCVSECVFVCVSRSVCTCMCGLAAHTVHVINCVYIICVCQQCKLINSASGHYVCVCFILALSIPLCV